MPKLGGYLFVFDEYNRSERLRQLIERYHKFSDAVSAEDWGSLREALCLLSFDGETLGYIAVVRGGGQGYSFKTGIEFSHVTEMEPVPVSQVEGLLGVHFRHHFVRMSQGLGRPVPEKTWNDIIRVVRELRPQVAGAMDTLVALLERRPETFSGHAYEVMSQEKDAVATALSLFGNSRRQEVLNWSSAPGTIPESFLAGLMADAPTEDDIIHHDAGVFGPLWNALKRDVRGAAIFERGEQSLWVFNANRKGLEHVLGVDLLYFHQAFSSYVLIQYKRMEKETESGEPLFRLTDNTSYSDELARMRAFRDQCPDNGDGGSIDAYRLNSEALFFKLCWHAEFEPFSRRLLPGYYVPLGLWDLYDGSDIIKGPQDGKRITLSTLKRYLSNTSFIQLVEDGWIGSRGDVTAAIDLLVGRVERDVDVVVAVSSPQNPLLYRQSLDYGGGSDFGDELDDALGGGTSLGSDEEPMW